MMRNRGVGIPNRYSGTGSSNGSSSQHGGGTTARPRPPPPPPPPPPAGSYSPYGGAAQGHAAPTPHNPGNYMSSTFNGGYAASAAAAAGAGAGGSNIYGMASTAPPAPAPSNGGGGGYGSGGSYGGYTGGGGGSGGGYHQHYNGSYSSSNPSAGLDYAFAGAVTMNSNGNPDDDKYQKKKRKRGKQQQDQDGDVAWIILAALAGGFFIWAVLTTVLWSGARTTTGKLLTATELDSVQAVQDAFRQLQTELRQTQRDLKRSERTAHKKVAQEVTALEQHNRRLVEERDELRAKHEGPEKVALVQRVNARESAYSQQVEWLVAMARRESKREVLERFGPGPHKVEITFGIPTLDEDGYALAGPENRELLSFVVEMAPIESAPHAVHLFLEQVDHGLLNGTYFYLNGPHILQAGPQLMDDWEDWDETEGEEGAVPPDGQIGTSGAKAARRSRSRSQDSTDDAVAATSDDYKEEDARVRKYAALGLEKLAFPDYSDDFPHVPWTLGFTGRPGGPDWYINKVDNSKGHGPGGQSQHALNEQGDSCFGIVSTEGIGREKLASLLFGKSIYADRSEWHYFLEEPVEIVGAVVLTKLPSVHKIHMDVLHHKKSLFTKTGATGEDSSSSTNPIGDVLDKAVQDSAMDTLEDPNAPPTTNTENAAAAAAIAAAAAAAKEGEAAAAAASASAKIIAEREKVDPTVAQHIHGRDPRRNHRHLPKIDNQAEA